MKKSKYLLGLALGLSTFTYAQNFGINTDGSDPDGDAILHIKNDASSGLDSTLVRIENEKATKETGVQLYNSGQTGTTAQWNIYIPGGTTDLRFKNNTSDHVTILNNGNTGIGTITPTAKLQVFQGAVRPATLTSINAGLQVGGNDVHLYAGAIDKGFGKLRIA